MLNSNNYGRPSPGSQMAGGTVKYIRRPAPPQQPQQQTPPTQVPASGKLMRLRCRFRPLHDAYLQNGEISDRDSDVVFICPDGRVRAHKIIISASSTFFSKIFEDQRAGSMTSVLIPDIPVATMKNLLLLAYRESLTMTKKQMREVADCLPVFGMNLKSFIYDDNIGSTNAQVQQMAQQANRPPPMMRPMQQQTASSQLTGANILQRQLGQPPQKPMTSMNAAGKGMIKTILGRPPVGPTKPPGLQQQQSQQQQRRPNETEGNESEGSNDSDYRFQLQGYEDAGTGGSALQQQLERRKKQIRLSNNPPVVLNPPLHQQLVKQQQNQIQNLFKIRSLNPVAASTATSVSPSIGNFRRIAPKPIRPPQPQTIPNTMSMGHEIQHEPADDDDARVADPEQGRAMIQEWMQNVGRNDNKKKLSPSPSQLPKPEDSEVNEPGSSSPGKEGGTPGKNQCLICNNVFEDADKWRWHETHHVGLGIFKCAFCDELFSTSRKVFHHEITDHGVVGTAQIDQPSIPSDFEIVEGRKRKSPSGAMTTQSQEPDARPPHHQPIPRMTLVKTANGTHYRRAPSAFLKKKLAMSKLAKYKKHHLGRGGHASRNSNINIGIGMSEGEELLSDRKIKQLHWVYVCGRCETCSDSLGKAQVHYNKCYPQKEMEFEDTVTKYRQGFFGRCKCPLCPRRYTTNHGFTIHSGHMHNDYRRKFNHSSGDDTIVCTNCRVKFNEPPDFHYHLGEDGECGATPVFTSVDKNVKWIGNETPGEASTSTPRQRAAPVKKSPGTAVTPATSAASGATGKRSTATTPTTTASPLANSSLSRSTRLANRRTMNHEEEIPEENFTPVECPICGEKEEPKIVEHLKLVHPDLDMVVTRVSETALRCQKCFISFSICDLVAHNIFCVGSKQFQYVKERQVAQSQTNTSNRGRTRTPKPTVPMDIPVTIPPGIGTSAIDVVENPDLLSTDVIKSAMECGVCGRTNKKFGIIAECLRSHGVYRCALCFNSYLERGSYSAHIRSCHTSSSGRLQCPLCPRNQFVNAGQVAGHMYGTHWVTILRDPVREGPPSKKAKVADKVEPMEQEAADPAETENPEPETDESAQVHADTSDTTTEEGSVNLGVDGEETEADSTVNPDSEDYSNITLGSLLKSSEKPVEAGGLTAGHILNTSAHDPVEDTVPPAEPEVETPDEKDVTSAPDAPPATVD